GVRLPSPCEHRGRSYRPPFPTRRSSDLRGKHRLRTPRSESICPGRASCRLVRWAGMRTREMLDGNAAAARVAHALSEVIAIYPIDRKSTRLNSSHVKNSHAVHCSKNKKI